MYNVLHNMAQKIWHITPLELYIIISVRLIRLELDITGEQISEFLGKNDKYIGNIESSAHNGKYSDGMLSLIASYITQRAKEKQQQLIEAEDNTMIKTEYTIYDFYPKDILNDEKVVKRIDPIPAGSGPTGTLNALIEATDFFKKARTLSQIVAEANKIQNQSWAANNFTYPLENAVKGKNKRLEIVLKDGLNTYTLPKKQKKV